MEMLVWPHPFVWLQTPEMQLETEYSVLICCLCDKEMKVAASLFDDGLIKQFYCS